MKQFRWRKGTIAESMGRKFWIFVRRLKMMRRILQICLIMMLPGFLWSGNESSQRADRLPSSGIYAYVADGGYGLRVIDVSDPTNPTKVGFCDTFDPRDVYVSGNYAYVADDSAGLRIIDISDPVNPFEEGFYNPPGGVAVGVYISGNYAYVADSDFGLRMIDISDPSNPFEISYYDSCGCKNFVDVSGNYAYTASGWTDLIIIDISGPANPFLAGFYIAPVSVEDAVVSGRYAYLGLIGFKLIKTDIEEAPPECNPVDRLVVFEIIDILDPSNPFMVSGINFPTIPSYVMGVYVRGNYVYAAAYEAGLRIIDVSDPTNPFVVGYYDTLGNYNYEVYVLGDYAYVADFGGYFRVIDISDPTMPSQVGLLDSIWGAYAVHVVDYEPPQVSVISPNGEESFIVGDTCDITWVAEDNVGVDSISIFYSTNAGVSWDTIATGEPDDSLYEWIIPDTPSDSCLVKILVYDPSFNLGEDQSDSFFSIGPSGIEENILSSTSLVLFQVSPNPFSKLITIKFQVPSSKSQVTMKIYDATGRMVKDFSRFTLDAQRPTLLSWDGTDNSGKEVRSGVYFCRFIAGDHHLTKKLLLLR